MAPKIKVSELKIFDLLKEAFSIPQGWKEEVYVEDGLVSFSSPMSSNSRSFNPENIHEYPRDYIGDLESLSISDFDEFFEREDGQVEIVSNDYENAVHGEYYDSVEITTRDEAIDLIATKYQEDYQPNERDANKDPILLLFYDILHPKAVFKDDAVRCERCGVEIWVGVDCDCGIDGVDHEGVEEAYEEKKQEVY